MAILSELILPVVQETEPKPGGSLLWAQWPCDGVVPVACWEETSPILSTHTCGGVKRRKKLGEEKEKGKERDVKNRYLYVSWEKTLKVLVS